MRQRAHFARHHRETLALIARASRLDRGVERQDVGLEGNAVDDRHDVRDLGRTGADVLHGADHVRHHGGAAPGHLRRAFGKLVGAQRVVGVFLDGYRQPTHR
ncbi:hypothetical protein D3C87_1750440 [compost metagenome]